MQSTTAPNDSNELNVLDQYCYLLTYSLLHCVHFDRVAHAVNDYRVIRISNKMCHTFKFITLHTSVVGNDFDISILNDDHLKGNIIMDMPVLGGRFRAATRSHAHAIPAI